MKIVIYHISDLHIEKKNDIKVSNVYKMVDVLNSIGNFDAVLIIVSGDIAFSGKHEQYDAAYHMFGTIISSIKNKFKKTVYMLAVPGNHDVDLSKDEGHKVIQDKIRSGITVEMIEQELLKQRNYLNYAKGIHCIDSKDNLCCLKKYEYEDKSIKICLINSAIFSTLDEDKGLHFIPEDVMKKMENELDADINITVMHHAHHWMNDVVKNAFENILIQKNNLILCGHEHGLDSNEIKKDGARVIYLTGGELCNRGNWNNSQFYLDIVDTDNMILKSISYIWNINKQLYVQDNIESYNLLNMVSLTEFKFEEEFEETLCMDPVNSISDNVFDYYVFPDLELMKDYADRETETFTHLEKYLETVKIKKRIAIIGNESAGKTLLLKKLYIELSKDSYHCLYCEAETLQRVSLNKALLTVFRKNYIDQNGSFDKFLQIRKEQKVILIDDIHNIDKNQICTLLNWAEEYFGIIIYATKELIELDLAERVKQTVELEKYSRYKILPMYKRKREILISKIVNIKEEGKDNKEICNKITYAIKAQRKMYSMNPSFIIQFTEFYLQNFKDAFATDGNVFSKVFENNIINKIRPVAKKLTVDKILVLLDEIAYWCYKNQNSEIDQESICQIISQYNNVHGDEVEYLYFVNACLQSKIIKKTNSGVKYRFVDKNILSYFIAREIIRIWNDDLDDTDMKNLIKYIRYGINSNIILFITYLTDNLYLIRNLIDSTIKYMENWPTIDIVNVNVPYLATLNGYINIEAPTQKEREKIEEKEELEDKEEIGEYEDNQIIVKDYFDTKIDDCEKMINQIIRSMTLLDIVSKCLPGFEHRMKKDDKDKIMYIIFNLPGKIFYEWAIQVEEIKDELLQYLLNEYRTVYLQPRDWDTVKTDDILFFLQRESLTLLLELLNIPMNNAVKDYTVKYLGKYTNQEETLYQIQMLMAYGKLDMVVDFQQFLKKIDENLKKSIPDYMKKSVIRRFLITSKRISNEQLQKMISMYFPVRRPNNIYKNILISREKNEKKQ
jgi:hypothetical protein